jgi:CheY-like chemotaxis protein
MGDGVKLKQILINILGNAVKFTPAPGTIRFIIETQGCCAGRCEGCGCHVDFIISDTGIGMDEEFIPKMFETFSQEDASSTNRYGGSGLGMAITRNLIDMMGGTISVESRKGEGTTFTIGMDFRPLMPEAAAAWPDTEETDAAFSIEGCNILFAEDVDINAEILADLLEMEGVGSERAEDGQVAVSKFAESSPGQYDAILMDMRMPVMDGLEATRTIRAMDREDARRIPIVALTANAFYSDIRQCLDAGMDAHLSKPVDSDLMIETLGRLINENRRYSQEMQK